MRVSSLNQLRFKPCDSPSGWPRLWVACKPKRVNERLNTASKRLILIRCTNAARMDIVDDADR